MNKLSNNFIKKKKALYILGFVSKNNTFPKSIKMSDVREFVKRGYIKPVVVKEDKKEGKNKDLKFILTPKAKVLTKKIILSERQDVNKFWERKSNNQIKFLLL